MLLCLRNRKETLNWQIRKPDSLSGLKECLHLQKDFLAGRFLHIRSYNLRRPGRCQRLLAPLKIWNLNVFRSLYGDFCLGCFGKFLFPNSQPGGYTPTTIRRTGSSYRQRFPTLLLSVFYFVRSGQPTFSPVAHPLIALTITSWPFEGRYMVICVLFLSKGIASTTIKK